MGGSAPMPESALLVTVTWCDNGEPAAFFPFITSLDLFDVDKI